MTAMLRNLRKWVRGVDREVNGLVRNSSNDGSDALVLSRSGGGWVFARRAGSRKPRVSRCPSSEEPPLRGFTAEKRARNNILVCFGARIWLHEFEPPRARSRGSKIKMKTWHCGQSRCLRVVHVGDPSRRRRGPESGGLAAAGSPDRRRRAFFLVYSLRGDPVCPAFVSYLFVSHLRAVSPP